MQKSAEVVYFQCISYGASQTFLCHLGVAAKYGKDSREYGQAVGVPKSERRRPVRQKATKNNSELLKSIAIVPDTNREMTEPITSNGNGKAIEV
ncbi:MAG TPA: hypothetical protein V6C65_07930 [Allocoleopsis sp.]